MTFESAVKSLKFGVLACVSGFSLKVFAAPVATPVKPTVKVKTKTGTTTTVPSSSGAAGASRSATLPSAPAVPVVPTTSNPTTTTDGHDSTAVSADEVSVNGFGKSTATSRELIDAIKLGGVAKTNTLSDAEWQSVIDAGFMTPETLAAIKLRLKDNEQVRNNFLDGLKAIKKSNLDPASMGQIINGVLLNIGSGSLKEAKAAASDFKNAQWDKLLADSGIEKRALANGLSAEKRAELIKEASKYVGALEKAVQAGSYDKLSSADQKILAAYFGSEAAAKQQTAENLKGHLENNQKLLAILKKNEPGATESLADHFQGADETVRMYHTLLNDKAYQGKLTRSEVIQLMCECSGHCAL